MFNFAIFINKVKIIKFSVIFQIISIPNHYPSFSARNMEVANCFGQFLKSEKSKITKINPKAKLNYDKVLKTWKTMTEEDKSKFRKKSLADKLSLGDQYRKSTNKVPKQMEEVKGKDRARRKEERKTMKKMMENEKVCSSKFKVILSKIESKYENLSQVNKDLEEDLLKLENENGELDKIMETKSDHWKNMYRNLYKEHEGCKRKL